MIYRPKIGVVYVNGRGERRLVVSIDPAFICYRAPAGTKESYVRHGGWAMWIQNGAPKLGKAHIKPVKKATVRRRRQVAAPTGPIRTFQVGGQTILDDGVPF